MSDPSTAIPSDFALPRRQYLGTNTFIPGASHTSFTSRFGHAFPTPKFLTSDLGSTALYDLPPLSGQSKRSVLIIHGLNTPTLGMYPLAKELQSLDPDAHIVLFDLWGHGFSSTPLVAHTRAIFHAQILQILSYMGWRKAHILGYSFGGATAVSFTVGNPGAVIDAVLVAPAGLLRLSDFEEKMQGLLVDSTGRENEAIETVLEWLEGGPLVVPDDAVERMNRGEIVAEALREWCLKDHPGYRYSVLNMFQEGGVLSADDSFRAFVGTGVKHFAVLGGDDPVCSEEQLREFGFGGIEVVEGADHAFVRGRAGKVAGAVGRFWGVGK